jgi:hypothetical protein
MTLATEACYCAQDAEEREGQTDLMELLQIEDGTNSMAGKNIRSVTTVCHLN